MLKKLIEGSAFDLRTIFEAIRIVEYFGQHGYTMADIKSIKPELILGMHSPKVPEEDLKEVTPPRSKRTKTPGMPVEYCPDCKGVIYTEPICPKCKEGQEGKRVRRICENYPECSFTELV